MPRSTMANLIAQCRNMLWDYPRGNPPGAVPQILSDDQIQYFLDKTRYRMENEPMTSSWNRLIWEVTQDDLEADDGTLAQLYLSDAYGTIKIAASLYTVNLAVGEFAFSAVPPFRPNCYGYSYDLYAAAAMGWFWLAGKPEFWKGDYGNRAMQMYELCLGQSKPVSIELVRADRLADLYSVWQGVI